MQALQAAIAALPCRLELLQEACRLQACGRCCLRLAGVKDPEAYSNAGLPCTALGVVAALQQPGSLEAGAPTDGHPTEGAGQVANKRRRLEPAESEPAAQAGAAADGSCEAACEAAAAAAASPAAVCPLCLGLLQLSVLPGGGGGGDSGNASQPQAAVHLVTTSSSLNDPARHASVVWGATAAGPAVDGAEGDGAAAAGEGAGDPSSYAPEVQQQSAAMPSIAAAAEAIAAEFEFDCFGLEVSLPASLAVRHQALACRLRQREQQQQQQQQQQQPGSIAEALAASVDVKEAARWCYTAALAAALTKPHDPQAALRVALSASHPDAAAECGWLAPSGSGGGRQQRRGRGRHGRQPQQAQQAQQQESEVPVLTDALVQRLASMSPAEFAAGCPAAAAQLASPAAPAAVALQARRRPLLLGGRYLKLRRGIPQSPWFIDGRRKGEGSVQEAIEQAVLPAFQADSCTMVSAGREDIDVRMLGEGRPFVLEIQSARRGMPAPSQLEALAAAVHQTSAGGVAVGGLFAASAAQLAAMKEGEQEKQKSYVAVCWLPRPLGDADLALLAATRDLEVRQETPIRVLHRRANLCRPKVIHELRAELLPGQPPGYFVLHLRTQAGTYIKEFVHGDLGRTRPSLGDLLGCPAQIVSLDVAEIHMQFGSGA